MKKAAIWAMLAAAGTIVTPGGATWAHHSVQNEFDVSKVEVRTGVLRKVDWVNPHAWFHFQEIDASGKPVAGADGKPSVWSLETTGPNGLRRLGLADRRIFEIGQPFVFSGYPARNGTQRMFTLQVKFKDDRIVTIGFPEDAPDLTKIPVPTPSL